MNQDDNVVMRLRRRLDDARAAGFKVRFEALGDEQPGWCQLGGSRLLFVNLSQTAAEQLAQIDETLRDFAASVKLADQAKLAGSVHRAA